MISREECFEFARVPEEFRGNFDGNINCRCNQVFKPQELDNWKYDFQIVFIYGPVGTGKTKLAVELMAHMAKWRGMRPAFHVSASLRWPWEGDFNSRSVAVLDDYLRFYDPGGVQAQSINGVLCAARYSRGWPTILTSNIKKVADIGDAAIIDRIGCGLIIEMIGDSRRRDAK